MQYRREPRAQDMSDYWAGAVLCASCFGSLLGGWGRIHLNRKKSDVGYGTKTNLCFCVAPWRDEAGDALKLCQCVIEGAGRKGFSKMEFSLVLLLSYTEASGVFRLSPATKTAFITSLFVLPASPALMFLSPAHHCTQQRARPTQMSSRKKAEPLREDTACTVHSAVQNCAEITGKKNVPRLPALLYFGCAEYGSLGFSKALRLGPI